MIVSVKFCVEYRAVELRRRCHVWTELYVLCRHIKGLSLAHNNIRTIPSRFFAGLKSLRYLKLDGNGISSLDSETFHGLEESLKVLELNSNELIEVRV